MRPHDDRVRAALGDDAEAMTLVEHDDLHAALLMRAAKDQGLGTALIPYWSRKHGKPAQRLRITLPWGVAYFRRGELKTGPHGASFAQCRHVNGSTTVVVDRKQASKTLMQVLGIPVPAGQIFHALGQNDAVEWFHAQGRPVCVKPDKGHQGNNVFPGLTTETEVRQAFIAAARQSSHVLVEEFAPGPAVRFFYVRPRIVGVRIDLPANVLGDGGSNIAALVRAKNEEKRLRTGHAPIIIDDDVHAHLRRLGLGLDHVPAAGTQLFLRSVSNGCKGGDSSTTSEGVVHPSYAASIAAMCNAIRDFNVTAIDTKIADPSMPASPDNYRILEINSNPGLVPYHFPWEGPPQNIAGAILRMLLKWDVPGG
ncbi:MAG: hypothetical protein FD176_889 [Rhodospirillaceae bacterium]|nr:MAG: hypothetical protein FD176_889 [Rhodospirillaceae bacterium]TNC97846.1 MAG: hypothetical protein FD119_834 [Stygiobacter sp.]